MEFFWQKVKALHIWYAVIWRTLITKKGNRLLSWQSITSPCVTPCTWRVTAERSGCIKSIFMENWREGKSVVGSTRKVHKFRVESTIYQLERFVLMIIMKTLHLKEGLGPCLLCHKKQVRNLLTTVLTHVIGQITNGSHEKDNQVNNTGERKAGNLGFHNISVITQTDAVLTVF